MAGLRRKATIQHREMQRLKKHNWRADHKLPLQHLPRYGEHLLQAAPFLAAAAFVAFQAKIPLS